MGIADKISDSEDKVQGHDQMNTCKCKLMELLVFDLSSSVGLRPWSSVSSLASRWNSWMMMMMTRKQDF